MIDSPLTPPLNCGAPIKNLERLWLNSTCAYDQFDENLMMDSHWDALTVELRDRWAEVSPYFKHAVPEECIISSTSSGIDWYARLSVATLCRRALEVDMPRRVAKLLKLCESPALG